MLHATIFANAPSVTVHELISLQEEAPSRPTISSEDSSASSQVAVPEPRAWTQNHDHAKPTNPAWLQKCQGPLCGKCRCRLVAAKRTPLDQPQPKLLR